MKALRAILIAIVVVGIPSAFVLLLSRSNPNIIAFLPDDWQTFIIDHDWIGFVVLGIELVAALAATRVGAIIKKREGRA